MDLKDIKQLIRLVDEKEFAEFELEQGQFRLRIKRNEAPIVNYTGSPPGSAEDASLGSATEPQTPLVSSTAPNPAVAPSLESVEDQQAVEANLHMLSSPIVGTFYRAASPTADPFVRQGDRVQPGMILCIVEAMKLMNEIPSDVAGEIVNIHVENGQPVEYGQLLFTIRVS